MHTHVHTHIYVYKVFKIRNKNLDGFFTFLLEFVKEKTIHDTC